MSTSSAVARVARRLRRGGLRWFASAMFDRVLPAHPALTPLVRAAVCGKRGLEIGGPSRVFSVHGMLPAYGWASRLDNINFSTDSAWETGLQDGGAFLFNRRRPPGTQLIREAATLHGVADSSYDFVLSSHCLEHVANPLGALQEWRRVVRGGGYLLMVLPDPTRSFDHRRPVTTLEHLRTDFDHKTAEDDPTHFAEVLAWHDLARDAGVESMQQLRDRVDKNLQNRCVHHHVFDLKLITAALCETGWRVIATEAARPVHLIALAQKGAT